MDNEDFDDLFGGGGTLEGSSQESLTCAAANLDFCESDDEILHKDLQTEIHANKSFQKLQRTSHQYSGTMERRKRLVKRSKASTGDDDPCFPTPTSSVATDEYALPKPNLFFGLLIHIV